MEPRLRLPGFAAAPSCRVFNLCAALQYAVIVLLLCFMHAHLYAVHIRTLTLSLSSLYILVFLHKCRDIDLHTEILIYEPLPSKKNHSTDMLISTVREQDSSPHLQFIKELCNPVVFGYLSRDIQERKDVEKSVADPI